ncbi:MULTISPECIES: acyl-CoA dehydrogenase family protein [Rodentibacter]|uniref:acyl-CoA dehydrogenase family protein n=1 Tax=Rodentibacter TaxID=1960084 RepID=UPI001CFC54DD|nr:acyl-CoA dehydrogenase family protein [Rodentibacter sp. JRC1]GJI56457.1 dehydrogenase [Rodentibacter sp. JRC1]
MTTQHLTPDLVKWLTTHANSLDQSTEYADQLLPQLVAGGVFKHGIPTQLGGNGNPLQSAIDAITEVARYSLTAAFCAWGHRTLIENLRLSQSPLHQRLVPELLAGERAGGTGLSNAVKFLSGIEELNVRITEKAGKYYLNGTLPWITNLSSEKFAIIFAADFQDEPNRPALILAIPSEAGLERLPELPLVALKGSHTHPVRLDNLELNKEWIISDNAQAYLAEIRPAFLGLQFGMAFGLAQKSLNEVENSFQYHSSRNVLKAEWEQAKQELTRIEQALAQGLANQQFITEPKSLFQLRIDIVNVVASSILLELQAGGGRGYLENTGSDFIRRWREMAFLPIVTPSAVQLRTILNQP